MRPQPKSRTTRHASPASGADVGDIGRSGKAHHPPTTPTRALDRHIEHATVGVIIPCGRLGRTPSPVPTANLGYKRMRINPVQIFPRSWVGLWPLACMRQRHYIDFRTMGMGSPAKRLRADDSCRVTCSGGNVIWTLPFQSQWT
jgi:hypothetical protein